MDDILGVEEERGFNLNTDKYNWEEHRDHFILQDTEGDVDFGEGKKNIFALPETEILIHKNQEVQMAVKTFGKGRGVYISGLPYSFENSRVLYRAVLWSASAEKELYCWYSSNYNVEVHAYVKNKKYCVVNNTYEPQDTTVYIGDGSSLNFIWNRTRLNGIKFSDESVWHRVTKRSGGYIWLFTKEKTIRMLAESSKYYVRTDYHES